MMRDPIVRRSPGRFAAAVLLFAALTGCGLPRDVYLSEGFSTPPSPYGEALARHTRSAELYQGFDTVAKAWATWKSPELRRVVTEASIRAFDLEGEAAAALREEENRAALKARELHAALYTPTKDWNDLDSPDTLWKAYLELPGGRRLSSLEISVVAKSDKSPVQYPYVTRWTREYRLLFPLVDDVPADAPPTLVLTGPLGRMTFAFAEKR